MRFQEKRFTSPDGLSLYFRDYGDPLSEATPVLCLGGLTRNSKDFHGLASWLAGQGRRVVCPDYRGRGQSDHDSNWRNYRPETYVGDVRHLLAAAGLHRVLVIGTSLGGLLAKGLGLVAPAALAGALLNDVGPEIPRGSLGGLITYLRDDRPMPSWEAAAEKLKATFPDWPARHDEDWMVIARATYRETERGIRFDWDPAIARPLLEDREKADLALWPLFHALRSRPLAVLRGERSDLLTEVTLDRMREARPDMIAATVPGVGHCPGLGEPESRAVLEALLDAVP